MAPTEMRLARRQANGMSVRAHNSTPMGATGLVAMQAELNRMSGQMHSLKRFNKQMAQAQQLELEAARQAAEVRERSDKLRDELAKTEQEIQDCQQDLVELQDLVQAAERTLASARNPPDGRTPNLVEMADAQSRLDRRRQRLQDWQSELAQLQKLKDEQLTELRALRRQ